MFLDTAIEDEDHSFWLIDAIWAQFYAVADDVPVRILLKTVVQILPELELENDPQKAYVFDIQKEKENEQRQHLTLQPTQGKAGHRQKVSSRRP
jgi:hypothetical protein